MVFVREWGNNCEGEQRRTKEKEGEGRYLMIMRTQHAHFSSPCLAPGFRHAEAPEGFSLAFLALLLNFAWAGLHVKTETQPQLSGPYLSGP